MSGARVLGGRGGLRVEGHGPILPGRLDSELIAALEVLGPASLASRRQALRRWSPGRNRFITVSIVDVPAARFAATPHKFAPEPIEIRLHEFGMSNLDDEYYTFAATYGDPDEGLPSVRRLQSLITPLVSRHRAAARVVVDDDEYDYGGAYQLGVELTVPVVGRTVFDAYNLGKGVLALIAAAEGGALRRDTTLDLLRVAESTYSSDSQKRIGSTSSARGTQRQIAASSNALRTLPRLRMPAAGC